MTDRKFSTDKQKKSTLREISNSSTTGHSNKQAATLEGSSTVGKDLEARIGNKLIKI